MKNLIQILFFILPLILLSMACDDETVSTDCIDESLIDPNISCITLWEPVCGCDNMTYGNDCGAGVTSWTQGECP